MTARHVNRVLAGVVALALVVASGLVVIESVVWLLDQPPLLLPLERWDAWLAERQWNDDVVTVIGVALGVAGILLLVGESWRRRPASFAMTTTGSQSDEAGARRVLLSRPGLEAHLRDVARRQDGVVDVTTRARRRRVKLEVTVPSTLADEESVGEQVGTIVHERLEELDLERTLKVRVDVERAKDRVR